MGHDQSSYKFEGVGVGHFRNNNSKRFSATSPATRVAKEHGRQLRGSERETIAERKAEAMVIKGKDYSAYNKENKKRNKGKESRSRTVDVTGSLYVFPSNRSSTSGNSGSGSCHSSNSGSSNSCFALNSCNNSNSSSRISSSSSLVSSRYLPHYCHYGISATPYRTVYKGRSRGMTYTHLHTLPTVSSILKAKQPSYVASIGYL